jgi:hypothetical protein
MLGLPGLVGTVSCGLSAAGGAWAAWALFQASPKLSKGKETLITAGIIMFLYGIASCLPDSSESFIAIAGVSIHIVQSLLAIGLAVCIFRSGQVAMDSMMELHAQKIYQYFAHGTTIGLAFIAAVGLVGSLGINYLSNKAVGKALTKNQSTSQRLQEIVNNEMEKADRLVQLWPDQAGCSALGKQVGSGRAAMSRRLQRALR